jgi:transitional endoplasmic reticulum ATPase
MHSMNNTLKQHLNQQIVNAEELVQKQDWAKAWRVLLKSSRIALDMAQKADGSEKRRYLEYCDALRAQAETIRKQGKLKRIDRLADADIRDGKRRTEKKPRDRTTDDKERTGTYGQGKKEAGGKGKREYAVRELRKLRDQSTATDDATDDGTGSDMGRINPTELEAVSFDDIAGLANVKKEIIARVILPYCDPEGAREFNVSIGGGMLLYGPPGTGKTMIAKAVANEVDAPFFAITPAHVIDKFVGESERKISDLFRRLRSYERAILFIDEAEGLLTSRSTNSTVMKRVVPQFLMELDGISRKSGGLMVIAATNVPWELDEASYRRLPSMIYVPLPDTDARLWLLKHLASGIKRLGEMNYDVLAEKTDGFSGSDLKELVRRTCYDCYCSSVEDEPEKNVTTGDFEKQLKQFTISVRRKDMDKFARFRDGFQR